MAAPMVLVFLNSNNITASSRKNLPWSPSDEINTIALSSHGVCSDCKKYKNANSVPAIVTLFLLIESCVG